MEEFRPLVADSVVVGAVNNGIVQERDFHRTPAGVSIKAPARKRFIEAYERRMDQLVTHPVFGYRVPRWPRGPLAKAKISLIIE